VCVCVRVCVCVCVCVSVSVSVYRDQHGSEVNRESIQPLRNHHIQQGGEEHVNLQHVRVC
jgi:hypothetical protein